MNVLHDSGCNGPITQPEGCASSAGSPVEVRPAHRTRRPRPAAAATALLIAALCTVPASATPPPTDGLIGHWTGDGHALDASALANHGSFAGPFVPGSLGQAFDLGVHKVEIPDHAAYAMGSAFSVAFWFNNAGRGQGSVFLGQDVGSGPQPKWFLDYGYTGPHFELHVNGPWFAFLPSQPATPSATGWHHLALVVGGGTYRFYFDGDDWGGGAFAQDLPNPSAPLLFGAAEALHFDGLMDEVLLYNRPLTPAEVTLLASAVPEPAPATMLLAAGLLWLTRLGWCRWGRAPAPACAPGLRSCRSPSIR